MIEVRLDAAQLEELAGLIVAKLRPATDDDTPLDVAEAAEALGVSPSTIVRRIKAGVLPTVAGLGRTLIPAPAVRNMRRGLKPNGNV